MNNKGQMTVGVIIILAVGIIFGIALLNASAESVSTMTTKQSVSNQSVDTTAAYINATAVNESVEFTAYEQSVWKQSDCPLTSVVLRNAIGTTLTATTDYVLDADEGTFTLVDTADNQNSNTTYVDYTYCADGYNTNGGSRTIANLIIVFGALIILAFVLEVSRITSWTGLVN